jgi:hypothetical protein
MDNTMYFSNIVAVGAQGFRVAKFNDDMHWLHTRLVRNIQMKPSIVKMNVRFYVMELDINTTTIQSWSCAYSVVFGLSYCVFVVYDCNKLLYICTLCVSYCWFMIISSVGRLLYLRNYIVDTMYLIIDCIFPWINMIVKLFKVIIVYLCYILLDLDYLVVCNYYWYCFGRFSICFHDFSFHFWVPLVETGTAYPSRAPKFTWFLVGFSCCSI